MTSESVSRFLNSRNLMYLLALLLAIGLIYYEPNEALSETYGNGFLFPTPGKWIANPTLSKAAALLCYFLVAVFFVYANRNFRLIKGSFGVCASLFFMLLLSQSFAVTDFGGGAFLLVVVTLVTVMLFSLYDNPYNRSRLYLIFLLLSGSSLWLRSIALLVPVFLIGCIQMKILDVKNIIAALLGILTPFWIVFGLEVAEFGNLNLPDYALSVVNFQDPDIQALYITVIIAAFVGVMAWLGCLVKIITFNAARRTFNGFYTLLFFSTIVIMFLDSASFSEFLPLMDLFVAFQLAHFFILNHTSFSSWLVISLMVGCLLCFVFTQSFI